MHNHPKLIRAKDLAARAKPDEAAAVRVLLKNVLNHRGFTLHGKSNHRYLFEVNKDENCHAIDVPVSVWMENKQWLARDLMGNPFVKDLLVFVVPWAPPATTAKPAAHPLPAEAPAEQELTAEQRAEALLEG